MWFIEKVLVQELNPWPRPTRLSPSRKPGDEVIYPLIGFRKITTANDVIVWKRVNTNNDEKLHNKNMRG